MTTIIKDAKGKDQEVYVPTKIDDMIEELYVLGYGDVGYMTDREITELYYSTI